MVAPKGWLNTVQSILSGVYGCAGVILGAWFGGHYMEIIGYRLVYLFASYIITGLMCVHLVLMMLSYVFTGRSFLSPAAAADDERTCHKSRDDDDDDDDH